MIQATSQPAYAMIAWKLMAAFCLTLLCALVVAAPSEVSACVPPSMQLSSDAGEVGSAEDVEDDHDIIGRPKHVEHEACCPGEMESGQCAADCDYCGCCGHMVGNAAWSFRLQRVPVLIEGVSTLARDGEGHSMRLFKPPRTLIRA
ncbi:hypothetical protein EA187_08835 [Lujinxingia sediminis]|uniref:DUF2946 domain-containing protein n=1 Tax=Lujinxingia sediminis TaxID=2480984 RepID=A0ABY0CU56_9DELT|nr:hypothetical protein [Lujinxingia sediminis]RVU45854.1 hypothetical protein EA187_08835 [Lujinxingia sediminis]